MSDKPVSPHLVAAIDQAQAASDAYLDGLVDAFQSSREEAGWVADGMALVACAEILHSELSAEVLAGALATAVLRLAREAG